MFLLVIVTIIQYFILLFIIIFVMLFFICVIFYHLFYFELFFFFFFQAEDGIRDAQESRGLGDVYKRQVSTQSTGKIVNQTMEGDDAHAESSPPVSDEMLECDVAALAILAGVLCPQWLASLMGSEVP
eukprot:TRINITY_DN8109_c0_g1_i7.p1 TRINITY_DN8109_c0_g1~~TRINITY_DN8109_c0_g1_i7.p1  ORF type:complete len:128 (+),score=29.80 TRINITY_DN8109_c0_g1_i7:2-385(+)